jgi:hypothetical protein
MGYGYDMRGRLACDGCGVTGGVRKRTCPYTVLGDSRHGARQRLRWCPPPAYCSACYQQRGGLRGVHAKCEAGAAQDQADADAIEAGLDAGGSYVAAAWGKAPRGRAGLPAGLVGVLFRTRAQAETYVLVPEADYNGQLKPWLSDYPGAQPWPEAS